MTVSIGMSEIRANTDPLHTEFDNGALKNDQVRARATMQQLLEPMLDPNWDETTYNQPNALVAMHTDVWVRIRKVRHDHSKVEE